MQDETAGEVRAIQRDVKKRLEGAFDSPLKKDWAGDDPKGGFDEKGVFSEDNWNDARINLFRSFFSGFFHGGISNQTVHLGSLSVTHRWDDDRNFVYMVDSNTGAVYYATWYKSRGRTDVILRNGQKITLENYRQLLQLMLQPLQETEKKERGAKLK
jgi:hypothetical protein